MSFNKFKNNELVIVYGYGKKERNFYKNKFGIVICRDPYFLDYNIKFRDGFDDWFNSKYIKKLKGVKCNENNLFKNNRFSKK